MYILLLILVLVHIPGTLVRESGIIIVIRIEKERDKRERDAAHHSQVSTYTRTSTRLYSFKQF